LLNLFAATRIGVSQRDYAHRWPSRPCFSLLAVQRSASYNGTNASPSNRHGAAPMIRLDADHPVTFCDGLSRRDFLHAWAIVPLGLTLPELQRAKAAGTKDDDVNCIMLFLVGGPSQLDTWDPKPKAPAEIRGPFQPIKTNADG